jgi:hypothetical protein
MALLVGLLALPFAVGIVASQFTGRPWRVFASPVLWSEAVLYLGYALQDDLTTGRVTAERYGARKTYTRKHTPIDYWFVIAFQSAALILFGWLDWSAIAKLLA